MSASGQTHHNIKRMRHGAPAAIVPGTRRKITLPDRAGLIWYAGVGAMTALELIEWPIALLIAGTHFVENHVHNRDVQQLAEGIDAGA